MNLADARIALIGLSGAGKSTVAPLLAKRLGYDWIDLDARIEAAAEATIAEVVSERGEAAFRELEARALEAALGEAARGRGIVIACGGGILGRESNRSLLRKAFVVWLQVTPEAASERLAGAERAKRPLLLDGAAVDALRALWEARRALYEASADVRIDTLHRSADEVAGSIHALWSKRQRWGSSES